MNNIDQWEYLFQQFNADDSLAMYSLMSEMGRTGWEAFSTLHIVKFNQDYITVFFKRKIQNGRRQSY